MSMFSHPDVPVTGTTGAAVDPVSIVDAIVAESAAHPHSRGRGIPAGTDEPVLLIAFRTIGSLAVGPEPSTSHCVVYPWSQNKATRERFLARALAESWCLRTGIPASRPDLDAIAAELLARVGAS